MFSVEIEHALKEWENGKKAHKVVFLEDNAKLRFDFLLSPVQEILIDIYFSYMHHMGNWKRVSAQAPAWAKYWRNHLMEKLLYDSFLYELQPCF